MSLPAPLYNNSPPPTPKRDYDGASSITGGCGANADATNQPCSSTSSSDATAVQPRAGHSRRPVDAAAAPPHRAHPQPVHMGFYSPITGEFLPYPPQQQYGHYYPMPIYAPLPLFGPSPAQPQATMLPPEYADPRAIFGAMPMLMRPPMHHHQPQAYFSTSQLNVVNETNNGAVNKENYRGRKAARRHLRKQRSRSLDTWAPMHRPPSGFPQPQTSVQQGHGLARYNKATHHIIQLDTPKPVTMATSSTITNSSPNTGSTSTSSGSNSTDLARYNHAPQKLANRGLIRHNGTLVNGTARGPRRNRKSCVKICCKGHIRLLWIILSILVAGVLLGVVMGLTLVD